MASPLIKAINSTPPASLSRKTQMSTTADDDGNTADDNDDPEGESDGDDDRLRYEGARGKVKKKREELSHLSRRGDT